ncbi:MAG: hypothetical protein U0350_48720 [Caldilineaceae bacterium]
MNYPVTKLAELSHQRQGWLAWMRSRARLNGWHLMGGPGSGKSRVAGRFIGWSDFINGSPLVMIDPTGGTIDNFLDKLIHLPYILHDQLHMHLPDAVYEQLWERIQYVDMSRQDVIVPFPLYYRLTTDESLYVTAQRFLDVVRRIDVALQEAPIEGFNALYKVGTYTGMILAALGLQITEAEDLIRHPDRWKARFEQAQAAYPEVRPAVEFFREFATKPELRTRRSEAFLTKILAFSADPSMAAIFGATTPGIDWTQVIAKRQAVLLDFRGELSFELRRFKLLWCLTYLVTFLKQRGFAGRQAPLSLFIDEVTQLLGFRTQEQAMMAEDLEELISVVARNYGVWLTIAHQSLTQLDQRIQSALMRMGTQMIGSTPDPDDALYLARQFLKYDPYWVKKTETVWMTLPENVAAQTLPWLWKSQEALVSAMVSDRPMPVPIDRRTIEFTPEEQTLLLANQFQHLGRFQFLTRRAATEGQITGSLHLLDIARLDQSLYPDEAQMVAVRRRLHQRSGTPLATLLSEIEGRRRGASGSAKPPVKAAHATLTAGNTNAQAETGRDLSKPPKPEDFWR